MDWPALRIQIPGGKPNLDIVLSAAVLGRAAAELRDMGLSMGPLSGPLLVSLLTICLALPASAQGRLPAGDRPEPNAAPSNEPAVLTGKERLGKKWMDEQRIDNCKVPIDKQGKKPRPGTCRQIPTG
jgi:hypothetical protein